MSKLDLLFKNPEKFLRLLREHLNPKGKLQPIKRPEYRDRFGATLADWFVHHQNEIITKEVKWMGIPMWKNVLDLHIYQEIIFEQSPEVIVEIGSAYGGSTLYFAHLFDILGKGRVLSVDVTHEDFQPKHDRIVQITGDSRDREIIDKVHQIAAGLNSFVIQDADHSKEAVLSDLKKYADLVPINGYFIIEDGIADVFNPGNGVGRSFDGPMCAVEEFLEENKNFVIDVSKERYLITQNPKGYLKRIA